MDNEGSFERHGIIYLANFQDRGLSIGPNPTSKFVNFNVPLNQSGIQTIDVVNINGKKFHQININPGENYWSPDHLPGGLYLVIWKVDGRVVKTEKLIWQEL